MTRAAALNLTVSDPCFPDIRCVADGGDSSGTDDRQAEQCRMFQETVQDSFPVLGVGYDVFAESLAVTVTEMVESDRTGDTFQFAPADSVLQRVNFLIGDAAFLEETFGFLCIKAFAAENLKSHRITSRVMLRRQPIFVKGESK